MPAVRPIAHEDRLSIVDHLDELRSRLIACVAVFVVAFAFCYAENNRILDIVNRPLEQARKSANNKNPQQQQAKFDKLLGAASATLVPALNEQAQATKRLAAEPGVSAAARAQAVRAADQLTRASRAFAQAAKATPPNTANRPVTLGVAEPFLTTFTVAGYAALLLTLPFILYELYAFVLPAFDRRERRVALPLMALVPVLFAAGVLFGYYVALPRAVDFLQNFNSDQFDVLVQASVYYKFVIVFIALMGLVFQIPVGVLALTRTGVVTARLLWQRQGYVILGISIVAAVVTPTPDPVTMLITMAPLVLLYELSIGLAWIFRPRGGSIVSRWEEWWDEDDEHEDDGPSDQEGGAAASDAPTGRVPLS